MIFFARFESLALPYFARFDRPQKKKFLRVFKSEVGPPNYKYEMNHCGLPDWISRSSYSNWQLSLKSEHKDKIVEATAILV